MRKLLKKDIWLFQEKHTEARDNAYHLYLFVKQRYPTIESFFVIKRGVPDEAKISSYGTTIDADSLKHYVYWLSSKYSINSQADGAAPYPTSWHYRFRRLCRRDQKVIFLQHGILKDDAPGLVYDKTKYDLFVCSAPRELDYVLNRLKYPSSKVKMVGLCRYDNLIDCKTVKKQVLIMPTFRSYLSAHNTDGTADENETNIFKGSVFYKNYVSLLSDERLISFLRINHFKIVFYLHYSLQSYTNAFSSVMNDVVIVADRKEFDVQKLLIESAVLITDFSSVFFDFAYMEKPEIFFQFDEEAFRKNHYGRGYFDYRRDAFGPVFLDKNDTINYLISCINNGCKMENKYKDRVDDFFVYRDKNNCERTYKAIVSLDEVK